MLTGLEKENIVNTTLTIYQEIGMKILSAARKIRSFTGFDIISTREVLEEFFNKSVDFEVNNYRFIHCDYIDKIQQDEISSDDYILGCFNANFLAGIMGISEDAVIAL